MAGFVLFASLVLDPSLRSGRRENIEFKEKLLSCLLAKTYTKKQCRRLFASLILDPSLRSGGFVA
jgi:hypothetical protein